MAGEYVFPMLANSVAKVDHGNAIEKREPSKAVLALEMLAEGKLYDEIAEATGLGFSAISSLKGRHKEVIEVRRRQLAEDGFEMAEKLRLLVAKKTEMLANDDDALRKVSLKDLVIPYAVAVDKGMQALGEAKTVVEHRNGKPSIEEAMAAIEEAKKTLRATSINV